MIALYAAWFLIVIPAGNSGSFVIPYQDQIECMRGAYQTKKGHGIYEAFCIEGNKL